MTRSQCIAAGLTPRAIERRIQTRGWSRWLPNVYLLPGVVPDTPSKLGAAALWGGDQAVLSHSSAAYIHGLEGSSASDMPEIYIPTGKKSEKVRTHRLPAASVASARVRGLRVVRVERTLADLAGRWTPGRLGEAMDDALRRGLTSLDRLVAEGERAKADRRPGSAIFVRLIEGRDHRDAQVRSRFETLTLRLLKEIEDPHANYPIKVAGRQLYLDFAYPDLKLAIECQSIRWHLGEEAWKGDAKRHRQLTAVGWAVLFVCWDDVMFERDRLRSEIVDTLNARRSLLYPKLFPE